MYRHCDFYNTSESAESLNFKRLTQARLISYQEILSLWQVCTYQIETNFFGGGGDFYYI